MKGTTKKSIYTRTGIVFSLFALCCATSAWAELPVETFYDDVLMELQDDPRISVSLNEDELQSFNAISSRECDGVLKCYYKDRPNVSLSVKCEELKQICAAECPTWYQDFSGQYEFEHKSGECDWVKKTTPVDAK